MTDSRTVAEHSEVTVQIQVALPSAFECHTAEGLRLFWVLRGVKEPTRANHFNWSLSTPSLLLRREEAVSTVTVKERPVGSHH